MAKAAIAILADLGIIKEGTIIELVPSICGSVLAISLEDRIRAVVVNPYGGRDAIRWLVDGQYYSAQSLLTKLEHEYGVCGIAGVYNNWRRVGQIKSITDEANSLGVNSTEGIPPAPIVPPPLKLLPPAKADFVTPTVKETGGFTKLQQVKSVLEFIAIVVTIIGGIAAPILSTK